jgi:DNA-binding CsgD family transcriptional regulator
MSHNVPEVSHNVSPVKNFDLALILATGATVKAAAEKLGISRRTAHRKLRRPGFRKLVAELRSQLFAAALGRMADNMTRASDALGSLLDASDPGVKLRAARATLSLALRLRDSVDVSDRLSELEAELARKQGVAP